jgi:hypothetical protein
MGKVRSVLVIALVLALAGSSRADEATDMKKLLDKASKALGGEDKLAKLKGVTQKGKGTIHFASLKATFEETSYWLTPDKYRFEVELVLNGNKVTEVFVLNGAKGWGKIGDRTGDLPKNVFTEFRDVFYSIGLAMRPMDPKAMGCKLSPLGEVKIDNRDALGVQIGCKGRPDVNLYVDKQTGLPIKCEVRSLDDAQENKEILHEIVFSDYKKLGDLNTFTKLIWSKDGKKFLEREVTESKAEESLDNDLFGKP